MDGTVATGYALMQHGAQRRHPKVSMARSHPASRCAMRRNYTRPHMHAREGDSSSEILCIFQPPDLRADTTEQSADTRADTAKYKRRAHKHGRYGVIQSRNRNFQYLALSGAYLRICSCIFRWIIRPFYLLAFARCASNKLKDSN